MVFLSQKWKSWSLSNLFWGQLVLKFVNLAPGCFSNLHFRETSHIQLIDLAIGFKRRARTPLPKEPCKWLELYLLKYPFHLVGTVRNLVDSWFVLYEDLRGWGKFGWTDFQNIWSMVHPPFCRKMMKHGVHPTFYQSELIVHEIILQNPLALLQWWPCAIICWAKQRKNFSVM